jgi:hypothetical protein
LLSRLLINRLVVVERTGGKVSGKIANGQTELGEKLLVAKEGICLASLQGCKPFKPMPIEWTFVAEELEIPRSRTIHSWKSDS